MIIFISCICSCPLCRSALLRSQVLTSTWLWVAPNKQAEEHPWLTWVIQEGKASPWRSLVTQCAGHCCVLAAGGRGIRNKEADDWFREMAVYCQKPVTAEQSQDDESSLKGYWPSLSLFLFIPPTWRAGEMGYMALQPASPGIHS